MKTGRRKQLGAKPLARRRQKAGGCHPAAEGEIDLGLLEDSLAKTPWERMLANDDALRFAEALRNAMVKRNAKSERTDTPTP
jgi:hypothetical protein